MEVEPTGDVVVDPMDVDEPVSNEVNEKARAQALVQERLKKYFVQLTQGCQNKGCVYSFCASNPALTPLGRSQAAGIALRLATLRSEHFCVANSPNSTLEPPFLNLEKLKNMVQQSKTPGGDQRQILRFVGQVFGVSENTNLCFLKQPTQIQIGSNNREYGVDTGLDFDQVKAAYDIIQSLSDGVKNSLRYAFSRLLNDLRLPVNYNQLVRKIEDLRQLQLIWEYPYLEDTHKEIYGPLLYCTGNLPEWGRKVFMHRWEAQGKEAFEKLLGSIHNFITLRVETAGDSMIVNRDAFVTKSVQILDMLFTINMKKQWVHRDAFYNNVLSSSIDMKDEYTAWKRPSPGTFSFCSCPFVLTPEVKAKILRVESMIQQRRERQHSLRMMQMGVVSQPFLVLRVHRGTPHLIRSSLDEIDRHSISDLKKELRIKFVGEPGVDEGGVQKEWFQLLIAQIFDPRFGMFLEKDETRLHWFAAGCEEYNDYRLMGVLIGLAIYNGVHLHLNFPRLLYKKLLGMDTSIEDLKELDPIMYKSFKQLLAFEGDVEETFDLTFQLSYKNEYDMTMTHDLLPDGSEELVTSDNREVYVKLYLEYLFDISIKKQWEAFYKGFSNVVESEAMQLFTPTELELLVCGSSELNFKALERGTHYDGYKADDDTVKIFWEVVHSFDIGQQKNFLFFATGSDRSPIGGLDKLNLVITKNGEDSERLPSSHTCFNHLLLPDYKNKEKLATKLGKAINNCKGFGLL